VDLSNTSVMIAGLVQISGWISSLVLTGTGLSSTVIVLRLLHRDEIKIGQLELKLTYFPLVMIALTLAHAYLTLIFAESCSSILSLGPEPASLAWNKLINSSAFVFSQMHPRHLESVPVLGAMYVAENNDFAFWLLTAFTIVSLAAVIASRKIFDCNHSFTENSYRLLSTLTLGSVLACANWLIGSQWTIRASALAVSS
jgi:hypothetical protein